MSSIIVDDLEKTARLYPNKIALTDETRAVTFAELRDEARRLASFLLKRNISHRPVVVYMNHSVDAVATMLGILYSGNFYCVLDVNTPQLRLEKILSTLQPALVIKNGVAAIPHYDIAAYAEAIQTSVVDDLLAAARDAITPQDIAYILFTSGSTGSPKGVVIGQKSLIDYIDCLTQSFGLSDRTILGNQAPLYFDVSGKDIYSMLRTGATLHLIPRHLFTFPARLLEFIQERRINTLFWAASALGLVARYNILPKFALSCLTTVGFGGEVLPAKYLNEWRRNLPHCQFYNMYGPTEVTINCTYHRIDRELADTEPIPIGKPWRDGDVLVLNEDNKLVQGQEIGEICVRGVSLAYGYYHNPEKTAEVFVINPLDPEKKEIIYRTGDLAHYNERGELIYVGRKDKQIKHMGYRIELGEIEAAALSLAGIDSVCALYAAERKNIILVYAGNIAPEDMREKLVKFLPEYMLPHEFIQRNSLPLNANGKIDRILIEREILEDNNGKR